MSLHFMNIFSDSLKNWVENGQLCKSCIVEDLFYTSFFICSSFRMRVGVSTGTVSRAHSREHACISAFNVVPSIVCYSIASLCCFSFTLLSPALSSLSGALLSPFHLARECNGHVVDYTVWSASITGSLLRSRRKRRYQISCRDLSFFLQDCKISFYLRHLTVKKGSCSPP